MTTSTSTTATSGGTARQAASSLADGAGTAAAIATGAIAAYATHRLAPARLGGHGRLLAAGTTGLVTAVLLDGLAWDVCAPLRDRFRTTPTTQVSEAAKPMAPLQTLEDALAHLTVDTSTDAEHRAAHMACRLDESSGGLLRDRRRWRGYPDGTASCYLSPGLVLHYDRNEGRFGPRDIYTLLTSDGDRPVTIHSLAQLRLHLAARTAGLPVAPSATDNPDGSSAERDAA